MVSRVIFSLWHRWVFFWKCTAYSSEYFSDNVYAARIAMLRKDSSPFFNPITPSIHKWSSTLWRMFEHFVGAVDWTFSLLVFLFIIIPVFNITLEGAKLEPEISIQILVIDIPFKNTWAKFWVLSYSLFTRY